MSVEQRRALGRIASRQSNGAHYFPEDKPSVRRLEAVLSAGFDLRTARIRNPHNTLYGIPESYFEDTSRAFRSVPKNAKEKKAGKRRKRERVIKYPASSFRWYET